MNLYHQARFFLIHRLGAKLMPSIPWSFFRWPLPRYVIIEPTNFCNLHCPLCPTNTTMKRQRGMMDIATYRQIMEELSSHLGYVAFNFAGEPTLNKQLFKMVKFAEDLGVSTYVSTNTTIIDRYLDEIFTSKLSHLTVCLDGASKKTHEAYRRGSNFAEVKENIKVLCQMKKRLGRREPKIELQFLVMKHNEAEIPQIINLARQFGVDVLSLKTVSLGSAVSIKEMVERSKRYLPKNPDYSRYGLDKGKLKIKFQPPLCDWVKKAVIYWNGDVTTCCYDFYGKHKIGNIFEYGSFKKLWYSNAYARMRKGILTNQAPLCKTCARTSEYGLFLTKQQLAKVKSAA